MKNGRPVRTGRKYRIYCKVEYNPKSAFYIVIRIAAHVAAVRSYKLLLSSGALMTAHWISKRAFVAGGIAAAAGLRGLENTTAWAEGTPMSALPDKGGTAPWDYWQSNEGTGTLRVASAAILSANPYNTQPWQFRLTANRIEVLANKGRNLANLDPYRRELYMGLGCALENACVAAPSQGLEAKVSLLPGGPDADTAAIVEFRPAAVANHKHHEAIALRHTHRGPYQLDRPVEGAVLDALSAQATDPDVKLLLIDARGSDGKNFSDLVSESSRRILDTAPLREGRHTGIKMTAPNTSEPELEKADVAWVEMTHTVACGTAAVFGLILVRGSRADHRLHMEAGRLWQRTHLEATLRGVAMQPMNHHIEVIDHETSSEGKSSVAARLNPDPAWKGWEPIFGFRAGYASGTAPASGRRPLSAVVIS
jgi:hypothetical protein